MVTVYRVQDASGRGPWRPGFSQQWIDDDAPAGRLTETVMDLMPIEQIQALPMTHHYGCGCRSLDALMAWFTMRERARLFRAGYHPVSMRADAVVAESDWQVLFARVRPLSDGATRFRWRV